ncbi:unannotated protein [freshwater metagenome]|uniref:Unannotated protein n=1 Tax=freshwater metagenome TaxID=449393 RepID=A0A6J7J5P4_9ZZZZ
MQSAPQNSDQHADHDDAGDDGCDRPSETQHSGGVIAEAEQHADESGSQAENRGNRHPAAHHPRGTESVDPTESESATEAHDDLDGDGDRAEQQRSVDDRSQSAAPPSRQRHADEPQRYQRRDLDRRRECDHTRSTDEERDIGAAQRTRALDRAQRQFGTREHEPDHQGLVVNSGDQVEQQQRVRGTEPQCRDRRDPAAACETRQRPDDQRDSRQGEQSVQENAGDDVLAGQVRDPAPHPQEQRTVGCRSLSPDVGHRPGQDVVGPQCIHGADLVGVETAGRDLALGQVGVDVAREHRRCDAQRQDPQQQSSVHLRSGQAAGSRARSRPPQREPAEQ